MNIFQSHHNAYICTSLRTPLRLHGLLPCNRGRAKPCRMQKWYAVHTRPRWEKKVTDFLEQKGIESYCPVKKVKRKWSDRMKTLEEPLFKSYVFVKITAERRTDVRMTEGVVNFVHRDSKLVQVKEKEIKALQKILNKKARAPVGATSNTVEMISQGASMQPLDFNNWLLSRIHQPKLI